MAKFKVGDWVKVLLPPNIKEEGDVIVLVLEVIRQTCEAGIEQTGYVCRIWGQLKGNIHPRQFTLREMELGDKIEPKRKENEK